MILVKSWDTVVIKNLSGKNRQTHNNFLLKFNRIKSKSKNDNYGPQPNSDNRTFKLGLTYAYALVEITKNQKEISHRRS